jgi:hypothetical protein
MTDGSRDREGQAEVLQSFTQIELAPGQVGVASDPVESYVLTVRMGTGLHTKLRYAQELLSHAVPDGNLVTVLDRALDTLVAKLERQKFAAARRERRPAMNGAEGMGTSAPDNARHIPAHVKRAVWRRDGSRCTFVGDAGRRCESRRFLEFDHVLPVAHGGDATVEGLRLLCRTHNQLEAQRVIGADFMAAKLERVRDERAVVRVDRRTDRRAESHTDRRAVSTSGSTEAVHDRQLIHALHRLGVRYDDARRAIAKGPAHDEAPVEERLRQALRWFGSGAAAAAWRRGRDTMLAAMGPGAMGNGAMGNGAMGVDANLATAAAAGIT